MSEYCNGCKERQDKVDELEARFSDSSQFSGYVACMIRQIPIDPGSETLTKLLNDGTTIEELKQWINKMDEGCTNVVEVKIVKAT